MITYVLSAIASPLLIAILVFVIAFIGQGSETLRYIVLYTSFIGTIPLTISHLVNVILYKKIKKFQFSIVAIVSFFVYVIVFWTYLFLVASADTYVDSATIFVFGFSIVPFAANMFLFWMLGIRGNELFSAAKLYRWRVRRTER